MNKIALITDSSCDLSKDLIEKHDISVIPLRVCYKDKDYKDGVDITADEIYARLETEIPTTSMPSPGDYIKAIEEVKSKGYTECIVVTISSGLSGTYSMFKSLSDEVKGIKVEVVDSLVLSRAQGMVVLEAARLIQNNTPLHDIASKLNAYREHVKGYFIVDTLEYLKKGGRIGRVTATIGTVLNLKPIIAIDEEGKYFSYAKGRGTKNAIDKMLSALKKQLEICKCNVAILSGMADDEAKKLYDKVKDFPNIGSICLSNITPSLVVHTGPGLVGIAISPYKE